MDMKEFYRAAIHHSIKSDKSLQTMVFEWKKEDGELQEEYDSSLAEELKKCEE